MRDSASATPSLHPAYLINKLNNYVKELNIILPNGTNIGAGDGHHLSLQYPDKLTCQWTFFMSMGRGTFHYEFYYIIFSFSV